MKRYKQNPTVAGIVLVLVIIGILFIAISPFGGLVGKIVSDTYHKDESKPDKIYGKVMNKDMMPLKEVNVELSNQDFNGIFAHTKTNSDGSYIIPNPQIIINGGFHPKMALTYSKQGYKTFEYQIRYGFLSEDFEDRGGVFGGQREIILILFEDK